MRIVGGTTDIPTAGTRVRLSNTKDRVFKLWVRTPTPNSVYLGDSTVSSTAGFRIDQGQPTELIDFTVRGEPGKQGSVVFDTIWADASDNGNDISWLALVG